MLGLYSNWLKHKHVRHSFRIQDSESSHCRWKRPSQVKPGQKTEIQRPKRGKQICKITTLSFIWVTLRLSLKWFSYGWLTFTRVDSNKDICTFTQVLLSSTLSTTVCGCVVCVCMDSSRLYMFTNTSPFPAPPVRESSLKLLETELYLAVLVKKHSQIYQTWHQTHQTSAHMLVLRDMTVLLRGGARGV